MKAMTALAFAGALAAAQGALAQTGSAKPPLPGTPADAAADKAHAMREREQVQNEHRLGDKEAAAGNKAAAQAHYKDAGELRHKLGKDDAMRYREEYQNADRMAKKAAARGDHKGQVYWESRAKAARADHPIPIDAH